MFIKLSKIEKSDAKYSQKGFYYPTLKFHFNFHLALEWLRGYKIDKYGFKNEVQNNKEERLSWYGVADNEQQIYEYYEDLKDSKRKFVISISPVCKRYDGGWRWHKWGRYIGTQKRTAEYLRDEEDIDLVYCFHLYEILN